MGTAGDAQAVNRYVRRSGNDSKSGLSAANAYKTIAKAMSVANAGDVVYVGAGTYAESSLTMTRDGTSASPITFIADKTGAFTGDAGTVTLSKGLKTNVANYFILDGFKISGTTSGFFTWSGGTGGIIRNCEVTGTDDGINVTGSAGVSIRDTYVHDTTGDGIEITTSSFVIVERCELARCGDDGFDVNTSAVAVLVDCYIHDVTRNGVELDTTTTGALTRAVVERCKIQNVQGDAVNITEAQVAVRNSLITGNRKNGVRLNHASAVANIWNSTVAANLNDGVRVDAGKARSQNSIYANNSYFGVRRVGGTVYSSYDLYYTNSSGATTGTIITDNMLTNNPLFQMSPTPYMLGTGSPAIDAGRATFAVEFSLTGIDISTYTKDLAGTTRPVGLYSDIGCYESPTAGPYTYYVSTTGNDTNSGLSSSLAFRTIGKAASVVNAGDTVYVASGTYTESPNITKSGTNSSRIKFISQTSRGAVISLPSANTWAINVNNAAYNEFQGFRFNGSAIAANDGAFGAYVQGSPYILFQDCEFDHSNEGIYAENSSVHLKSCSFHDLYAYAGRTSNCGAQYESCTFSNVVNGPYSYRDSYYLIKGSTLSGATGWCLQWSPVVSSSSTYWGTNTPTLQNSNFTGEYGLYMSNVTNTSRMTFTSATIRPTSWELYVADSTVTINPTWRNLWNVTTGSNGIHTYRGTVDVNGMTFNGYTTGWGLYCENGDVTVTDTTATNCLNGAGFYKNDSLSLTRCDFVDNKPNAGSWGVHVWAQGPVTVNDVEVRNNSNGMSVYDMTDALLSGTGIVIANNTTYGLYAETSDLGFTAATVPSKWSFSSNGYALYTYKGTANLQNITLAGSTYWAALTYYGTITVGNCRFENNGDGGLWSYNNVSANLLNSTFTGNGDYGLAVATSVPGAPVTGGNVTVTNCSITNNTTSGVYLYYVTDSKLAMTNTPISGHPSHGIYAYDCNLTFDTSTMGSKWMLSNNGFSISTEFGTYLFKDLTLSGATQWNVHTSYSNVTVRNCTVSGGANGMWSNKNMSFVAENSNFSNNSSWGLAISTNDRSVTHDALGVSTTVTAGGPATLTNCQISNNGYGGLYALQCTDARLSLTNCAINSNTDRGLEACDSNLVFSPATMGSKWRFTDNGTAIVTTGGAATFQDVTISNNRNWGAITYYGDITVNNCNFTNNGYGGFWSYKNNSCSIQNASFTNNATWGAAVRADGKTLKFDGVATWSEANAASAPVFTNCSIDGNATNGLYLEYTNDANINLVNTPIKNHPNYGVYAYACDLTFSPTTMSKWNWTNNGCHLVPVYGKTTFSDVEIKNANQWAVYSMYGNVTATNSKFTGSAYGGFWAYGNTSFNATGCTFSDNPAGWGLAVATNMPHDDYNVSSKVWSTVASGTASVQNCNVERNLNGLYCYQTNGTQLSMSGLAVKNNTENGMYAYESDFTFNSSNVGSAWVFSQNGTNITTYYGTILFDGVTVNDARVWGAQSNYGNVTIKNATFQGNTVGGFSGNANTSLLIQDSTFNGNGTWGAAIYTDGTHMVGGVTTPISGTVTFENCQLSNNGSNGLYLGRCVDSRLVLTNTRIENNPQHGVYAEGCTLALTPATITKWNLNNNGYGFTTVSGTTTIDGVTLSTRSRYYAATSYYANWSANNLTINGDGGGVYGYLNDSFSLQNSNISNTTNWGVSVSPKKTGTQTVDLNHVTLNANGNGVYIVSADQNEVALRNTTVTNNTGYGVCFYDCRLTINDQASNNWSSTGNGHGIGFIACPSITARNLVAENANYNGLVTNTSNVAIESSRFTGTNGVYSYKDTSLTLDSTRLEGRADGVWGWGLANYGSPVTVRNGVIANFYNGVYAYAYDDTLTNQTKVLNTTIASTNTYGVYFDRVQGQLLNSIVTSRSGTSGLVSYNGAAMDHGYNLVYGYASPYVGTAKTTGEFHKNPRFVNSSSGDYQLAKGSPAINMGLNIPGVVDVDLLGQARGSFHVWEMGAYEFMSPSGSLRVTEWKEKK